MPALSLACLARVAPNSLQGFRNTAPIPTVLEELPAEEARGRSGSIPNGGRHPVLKVRRQ
jgi:hypothetical protein